jgi:hypothetical protein
MLVLTSLKANFNIFHRCHVVVLFTFHKWKPKDTSKIMRTDTDSSCYVAVMGSLIVLVNKRAD